MEGEALVATYGDSKLTHRFSTGLAADNRDAILGLCSFRKHPGRFISGSSQGILACCDLASETVAAHYPVFDKLTSVHLDCVDKTLVVGGYSPSVSLIDLETGTVSQVQNKSEPVL